MKKETISIIIPTYQCGSILTECLDSIFAQTRLPDEVIVVNDGSTDDTEERMKPYLDRIQYISQENQGEQAARTRGFNESTGLLVLFCDADVILRPTMIEKMEHALEDHQEAAFAYSSFKFGWKLFKSFPFDADRLRKMNYIHTSALIRREDFPGFDLKLKKFQDWDLWLSILSKGRKGVFIDELLFEVRVNNRRGEISNWLPSFMYRWPWKYLSRKKKAIQKYEEGTKVIQEKYGL